MSSDLAATVKSLAEVTSLGFELAAISLLMILSIASVVVALIGVGRRKPVDQIYIDLRRALMRSVLISLELLVIADLIATVAIDLSMSSLLALGLLVVIRTFLSFSLEVEVDGAWPWTRNRVLGRGRDGTNFSEAGPGP